MEALDLQLLRRMKHLGERQEEESAEALEDSCSLNTTTIIDELTLALWFAYERSDRRYRVYTFENREELEVLASIFWCFSSFPSSTLFSVSLSSFATNYKRTFLIKTF